MIDGPPDCEDICNSEPINSGWDYNRDKKVMEYSHERAMSDRDEPCVRTAKILQKIGNTISNCIQLTYDTPALNVS